MRKNVLSLSIQAMLGGYASSQQTVFDQQDDGTGHIWVVPYYEHRPQTVIHVVNEDTTPSKALKVRFRGAASSDDVLDFSVFLSPGSFPIGK